MIVKIDKLGRLVIPKAVREYLNIKSNDTLKLEVVENKIIISK